MSTEKVQEPDESKGLPSDIPRTDEDKDALYTIQHSAGEVTDRLYLSHVTQEYSFDFNRNLKVTESNSYIQEYVLTVNPGNNCKDITRVLIHRNDDDIILSLNDNYDNYDNTNVDRCIEVYTWIQKVHFVKTDELTIASLFPGYNQRVFIQLLLRYLNVSDTILMMCKNGMKYDLLNIFIEKGWLTDMSILNYFSLIQNRSEDGSIYVFSSHFWVCLCTRGYNSAKKFAKNVDLLSFKKLYLPINLNNHWVLFCIDIKEKKLIYFDSFIKTKILFMHSIANTGLKFITQYYRDRENYTDPNFEANWETIDGDSPLQGNTDDAGVFVCVNGELNSRNSPSNFCHTDIILLRQRIAFEILLGRLIFNEDGFASTNETCYDIQM